MRISFIAICIVGMIFHSLRSEAQTMEIVKDNVGFIIDSEYTFHLKEKLDILLNDEDIHSASFLSKTIENSSLVLKKNMVWPVKNNTKKSPEDIYEIVKKNVLLVGVYNRSKNEVSNPELIASAYIINSNGLCVSNYHVLRDIIQSPPSQKRDSIFYFVENYDGDVFKLDQIFNIDSVNDVGLFQINTRGFRFNGIPIGMEAKVGTPIFCVSNPEGNYFYFSQGHVVRNYVRNKKEDGTLKFTMGISADYAGGSSGAPIVDQYGNLVGMVSSTFSMYSGINNHGPLQMVLKNAVPLHAIKNLLPTILK